MTATLIPQQLDEETDVETGPVIDEPETAKADTNQLALLLAQAYIGIPLFP